MSRRDLPLLLPTGTARQSVAAKGALPGEIVELFRASEADESVAFLAWQLAQMAASLTAVERERFMLVVGRLLMAQTTGSTCLPTSEADRAVLGRETHLVQVLAGLLSQDPASLPAPPRAPLVLDGSFLYTGRAHAAETRVADHLRALYQRRSSFAPAEVLRGLDDVAKTAAPAPSAEQRAAVAAVLARHLGIISGGPGTGKTTTVLALVRTLVRVGVSPTEIALGAPTGKAASRLENDFRGRLATIMPFAEADRVLREQCPQAQTLHRLLGASRGPGGALRTTRDPLPFRAVVVDESSMMDLDLMDRLLAALADDAMLFLLGDADQLPSVAAGAVFRDLGRLAVRLERGFRADVSRSEGKRIAELAATIRRGDGAGASRLCTPRQETADVAWQGAESIPGAKRSDLLRAFSRRTFHSPGVLALANRTYHVEDGTIAADDARALDELADHLASARVLAVTRARNTGVERCNAFLHELHGGGPSLLAGEPVLMSRNDYERDLWNGDQGVALRVERSGHAATLVAFRTRKGWRVFEPRALAGAIELGFVLTVHKAQGSEMNDVLLLLPDSPSPLLTRELLYTAVSRARRSVVVCGELPLFVAGVAAAENRGSQLARRLGISATE
jgi:exodeoxyribonuclease V alpha subunit